MQFGLSKPGQMPSILAFTQLANHVFSIEAHEFDTNALRNAIWPLKTRSDAIYSGPDTAVISTQINALFNLGSQSQVRCCLFRPTTHHAKCASLIQINKCNLGSQSQVKFWAATQHANCAFSLIQYIHIMQSGLSKPGQMLSIPARHTSCEMHVLFDPI